MKRTLFILANSVQLTTEFLRDQIRELCKADARFLKDGSAYAWVQEIIAPSNPTDSWKAIVDSYDQCYSISFTIEDGKPKLGNEMTKVARRSVYVAIGNSKGYTMAVGNNAEIDEDGWALIAPFGEHPKTRTVKLPTGGYAQQSFVQVLDNAAAEKLVEKENGLFRRLRRAVVGIPVYADPTGLDPHPDLRQLAPETLTTGNAKPIPAGVIDDVRLGEHGIEAHFTLTPDGAIAVENGAKFPSALWQVALIETLSNGTHRVSPFKLLSVGLTPYPNIDGVDSLANAKPGPTAANHQPQKKDTMLKSLIIGWLAGQGVTLANDAGDQVVFDALRKAHTDVHTNVINLGNSKTALETQLSEKTTALGNAEAKVKTLQADFKKEREARISAAVDVAIHQGKVELARRDEQIAALGNSQDLVADLQKMDALPVKFSIGNAKTEDKGKGGAAMQRSAREQVFHLANNDERYKSLPWETAYPRILQDHPTLADQLKEAPKVK